MPVVLIPASRLDPFFPCGIPVSDEKLLFRLELTRYMIQDTARDFMEKGLDPNDILDDLEMAALDGEAAWASAKSYGITNNNEQTIVVHFTLFFLGNGKERVYTENIRYKLPDEHSPDTC